MTEFLIAMGIPSAITGLLVWWLKRYIDKKEAERQERETNTEKLIMMIMNTSRATNILATATAKAVQRIPSAKCNGDMKSALEEASKIHKEEKEFLYEQGIKHIVSD